MELLNIYTWRDKEIRFLIDSEQNVWIEKKGVSWWMRLALWMLFGKKTRGKIHHYKERRLIAVYNLTQFNKTTEIGKPVFDRRRHLESKLRFIAQSQFPELWYVQLGLSSTQETK